MVGKLGHRSFGSKGLRPGSAWLKKGRTRRKASWPLFLIHGGLKIFPTSLQLGL